MIIRDQYELVSTLLRTPIGHVYRALDQMRDREPVIIKELIPDEALGISEEEIRDRYKRETSVLQTIQHHGIPRLISFFTMEKSYYIVLECFEGETLDSLSMKRSIPFPVGDVMSWALELCEILDLLHYGSGEPIIFRDITPSNIIIDPSGGVRLGDFGLSRYFNPQKIKDTFVMGTPGFSPPEQYGRGQSDVRSDIYSLGATLFFCLSLRSIEEFSRSPANLKKLNPLVPRSIERIVTKCTEKNPGKRYQSVRELKSDIQKDCIFS